jgi:DNA-binding response OmpR family regulator
METFVSAVKTVWVTDDDEEDLIIFVDTLQSIHPSIKLTGLSGSDELLNALAFSSTPDLLFLDLYMPCTNGKDCLAAIRAQQKFENLPIIIYSSSTNPADISYAYEAGANLYIHKPCTYNELCAVMDSVLQLNWNNPKEITSTHYLGGKYVPFMAK